VSGAEFFQTTTGRGFEVVGFVDGYGLRCSLQQSSLIGEDDAAPGASFLWLGMDTGDRMHLSREHVTELVMRMTRWLATGSIALDMKAGDALREAAVQELTKDLCLAEAIAVVEGRPTRSPFVAVEEWKQVLNTVNRGPAS
jgi:hypothetical protein